MRKLMFMFALALTLVVVACSGPNKETIASLENQSTEMQTLQTSLDEASKNVEAEVAKLTEAKTAGAVADSLVAGQMENVNKALLAHKELSTRIADILTRFNDLKTNYTAGSVKEEQLKTDNELITNEFTGVKEEKDKIEAEIANFIKEAGDVITANAKPAAPTAEATPAAAPAKK